MKQSEFSLIAVILDECWPGDFNENAERAYFTVLNNYSADQVMCAVQKCIDQSVKFRPTPGEIVKRIPVSNDRIAFLESQKQICEQRYGAERANAFFPNSLMLGA